MAEPRLDFLSSTLPMPQGKKKKNFSLCMDWKIHKLLNIGFNC